MRRAALVAATLAIAAAAPGTPPTVRAEGVRAAANLHALVSAGKPAEAIAEAERMIRLHPAHARHHSELALIYLEIGMGAAARRAARQATVVEPRSSDAYAVLGHVLRHDSLGRDRGFDHDRAGALAAFERALAIAPAHVGALTGLVETLAYEATGFATGDAERLRLIQALRELHAAAPTEQTGADLVRQLLHLDPHEAARVARELPAGETRDAMIVATTAAGPRGPAEAIQLAGTLRPGAEARARLLSTAGRALLDARLYDPMRAICAEPGVRGLSRPEMRARIQREPPRPVGRDPAELWFALEPWWTERGVGPFWDAQTAAEADALADVEVTSRFSRVRWIELGRARSVVRVSGTEAAWRLEVTSGASTIAAFAAADRGVPKLIGLDRTPGGVARHVLRLLARGDTAAAAQLLDWIAPLVPRSSAVVRVWAPGMPRDRDAIALAAQLLTLAADAPAGDLSAVVRCASPAAGARELCDQALAMGYEVARRWPELLAHATAWTGRGGGTKAEVVRATALRGLRRHDDADRALAALAAADPTNLDVERERVFVAVNRHDYDEAVRRADAVLARPGATNTDRNNAAWLRVFTGTGLDGARAQMVAVVGPTPDPDESNELHTLGSIEAELGNLAEAKRLGWVSVGATTRRAPTSALWYLAARIAERLGLRDDAIAMYRKVKRETDVDFSSYDLAQRGLTRLAGAKKGP